MTFGCPTPQYFDESLFWLASYKRRRLSVLFAAVKFYNFGKGGTTISFEKVSNSSPLREISENETVGGFGGLGDFAPLALACKKASVKLHPLMFWSAESNFYNNF